MLDFRIKPNEKLKSRKVIQGLFSQGDSSFFFPIKYVYITVPTGHLLSPRKPALIQVAFTAPKSIFKSAVKRNRIKRLMREGYRHQKHFLYNRMESQPLSEQVAVLAVMCIYVAREEVPLATISKSFKLFFEALDYSQASLLQ